MKKSLVLGIMSGTSIDSVDYALCEIGAKTIRLRDLWSARFPKSLQAALHAAARGDLTCYPLAQLHHDLGRFYAKHAGTNRPDFIGLHGQTVFHNPSPHAPAMLQLGEPAYLVEALRAPVVNNFRAADMAAGGQGAPLATIFHQFVFARPGCHICVNNIGGISNVTSLNSKDAGVLAFDTGPGNVLIDMAMRHLSAGRLPMDKGGKWAARGRPAEKLLARWLQHDYFAKPPPKSTGRELFGEPFFKKAICQMRPLPPFDQIATLTEFTARSMVLNYRLHLPTPPDEIILTGGGACNPALIKAIATRFAEAAPIKVTTSATLGWPVQSIEPAAFALLAWLRMTGQPGNLPKTTGARRAALLGQVSRY